MATTKVEMQAANVESALNVRLGTGSYPTPAVKSYDGDNDLYLTLADSATRAIVKFEVQSAPESGALNMFGRAQQVYSPHMIKVGMATGAQASATATIVTAVGAVRATATATLVNAQPGDKITIQGHDFAAVAAGATGDQWLQTGDDTADAAALAAAINNSVTAGITGVVNATSNLGVVTIRSVAIGTAGNAYTITENTTGTTITLGNAAGGHLNSGSAGNTVVINGVTFYAIAAAELTVAADQWKVGSGGGADTTSAANLAAAINASTTTGAAGVVTATSSLGVATVKAVTPGLTGNAITFTKSGAPITLTGSGFLAGGTAAGITEAWKATILAQVAIQGMQMKVYEKESIAVGDMDDDTYLIASFGDLQYGLMASV